MHIPSGLPPSHSCRFWRWLSAYQGFCTFFQAIVVPYDLGAHCDNYRINIDRENTRCQSTPIGLSAIAVMSPTAASTASWIAV